MTFMRGWALSVAGAVIFGAVCELLLPAGEIKKYVKIVLGLVLVFAVISPFASFSGDDMLAGALKLEEKIVFSPAVQANETAQIIRVYKQKLNGKMEQAVGEKLTGMDVTVRCEAESEIEGRYGEITGVQVMLTPNETGGRLPPLQDCAGIAVEVLKNEFGIEAELVKVTILR